jgi:hypothetical protein
MTGTGKLITGSLLGAGLLACFAYWKRLNRMENNLVVVPSASLAKLNLDGLIIRVDAILKNPTKGSFSLKFPFLKLLYKDVVIGSSQAVNRDITIPAFSEARVEKILVNIPVENLFTMAASIFNAIRNKEKVKLKIQVVTEVDVGLIQQPYQSTEEVVLAT